MRPDSNTLATRSLLDQLHRTYRRLEEIAAQGTPADRQRAHAAKLAFDAAFDLAKTGAGNPDTGIVSK